MDLSFSDVTTEQGVTEPDLISQATLTKVSSPTNFFIFLMLDDNSYYFKSFIIIIIIIARKCAPP